VRCKGWREDELEHQRPWKDFKLGHECTRHEKLSKESRYRAGGVSQVVEHLPSKHEDLSSNHQKKSHNQI
jgi:hypothetical protein